MNCRQIRSLMSAYIDRELTGIQMLEIRDHVSYCSDCRSEHESLLSVKRLLSRLPDKEPVCDLTDQIDQRIAAHSVGLNFVLFFQVTRTAFRHGDRSIQRSGKRLVTSLALSMVGVVLISTPSGKAPFVTMAMDHHKAVASSLVNSMRQPFVPYSPAFETQSTFVDELRPSQLTVSRQPEVYPKRIQTHYYGGATTMTTSFLPNDNYYSAMPTLDNTVYTMNAH